MLQEDWKRAINKAIENVTPPERGLTDHTLAMSNSEPGATCCACGRLMKGLFYQGYQCSVCKLYAHRACIADMPKCGAAPQPQHSESKLILKVVLGTFTVEVQTKVSPFQTFAMTAARESFPPTFRPGQCQCWSLLQRRQSARTTSCCSDRGVQGPW